MKIYTYVIDFSSSQAVTKVIQIYKLVYKWAIPKIRGTPLKKTNIFQVKSLGIPSLKFWPLKNGNSKNCFKKWEFPIFLCQK